MQRAIRWLLIYNAIHLAVNVHPSFDDASIKFEKIRLRKKSFETVRNLHVNWYVYAIKALMGQLGKQLYQKLSKDDQQNLAHCLDNIADEKDVVAGAQCLINARIKAKYNRQRYTKWVENLIKVDPSFVNDQHMSYEGDFMTENDYKHLPPLRDPSNQTRHNRFEVVRSNVSSYSQATATSSFGKYFPGERVYPQVILPKDSLIQGNRGSKRIKMLEEILLPVYSNTSEILINARIDQQEMPMQRKNIVSSEGTIGTWIGRFRVERRPSDIESSNKDGTKRRLIGRKKIEGNSLQSQIGRTNLKSIKLVKSTRWGKAPRFYPRKQWCSRISASKQHGIIDRLHNDATKFQKREWLWQKSIFAPSCITTWKIDFDNPDMQRIGFRPQRYRGKRSPHRLVVNQVNKSDNDIVEVQKMDGMPNLLDPKTSKTPVERITNLIRTVIDGEKPTNNWSLSYDKLLKFQRDLDAKRKLPGAKVYEFRLFDLVMDNERPSKSPSSNMSFPDFLTMAFDLIDALGGKNRKDNSNVKFLSPRFAPLMPDKVDASKRHLSPSILAFYNDESQDTIASLPKILEATGLAERDRQALLEMVMDVSGAKKAVEMGLDLLQNLNFFGIEGELFEVTKRLDELFKSLEKSFSKIQNNEIAKKGFTFLDVKQIKTILKEHGVKDTNEVEFDVDEYGRLNRRQREEALWKRLELIAKNITSVHKRTKRALPVSVLSPVVLAPYMFSPVIGLTILGPVVLSPSIFSPLILNPSVLGPFVLSPAIAMPFILSPYVLSPYVLTPIVMAPFILNPYVLSPNVINPYILSPLILSPYVLCPDVISPQALGGQILSPSVLSPSFLTESVLMASVLSPTFLS